MELALFSEPAGDVVDVFHPLNLNRKSYASILPSLIQELQSRAGKKGSTNGNVNVKGLEVIPLDKWILRVRQDLENRSKLNVDGGDDLQALLKANPAAKLLDFYEALYEQDKKVRSSRTYDDMPSVFETIYTAGKSSKLQEISGITQDWIAKWIEEWVLVA